MLRRRIMMQKQLILYGRFEHILAQSLLDMRSYLNRPWSHFNMIDTESDLIIIDYGCSGFRALRQAMVPAAELEPATEESVQISGRTP
ncbi:hypothetical protein PoB_005454700 [Plakobranchus ocellatus]|uniref:Uncharacterized protein n=1 Tax=Plakobranchus ocellatus TaxID=259542 RepID=A0AAV4C9K3_9GAST|nr:hypothetical protein PoB_005454700 [Plakobranchus ocellatus]